MENGERFDKRTEDVACETECQCDGPGQCPVYDIYMNETRYKRCKYDCEWRNHYSSYYGKLNMDNIQAEMNNSSLEKHKAIIKHREELQSRRENAGKKINAEIDEVMTEVAKEGVNLDNYTEKQEGLGDLVSNVLSKLGVTEDKIQKWSNMGGCGCGARKKFLNTIMPFRKKE